MCKFKTKWISVVIRELVSATGVLALIFLAFSHQPIGGDSEKLFRLADGSIPVFCGSGPLEEEGQDYSKGCEACRISSGIALPNVPCEQNQIIYISAGIAVFNYQLPDTSWNFNRSEFARAPPLYI